MMSQTQPAWEYLPTPALLSVFSYLNYKELSAVGEVCKRWFSLSRDEFLWKELFYYNFNVDRSVHIIQGKSWYDEFKRLCDQIPLIQTEYLDDHLHQVLHVSFSHNGEYFATTSKDGFVLVWTSTYPAEVKFHRDMKAFSWKYTQYSQFNESDTLLLVSGVHFGSPYSTSGEIAVFNLQDGFQLQCRVMNKPYDIFGTWYSDQYLLSGDLHWLAHLVSTSVLWINKASQEIDSEHVPVTHLMYKFYNRNASSIRAIMVANCLPNSENAEGVSDQKSMEVDANNKEGVEPEHGNPVSHRDINLPSVSNQVVVPMRPNQIWRKSSDGFEYATPIRYNREYRKVESEKRENHWCSADDDEEDSALEDDDDVDDTDSEEERAWTHLNLDPMVSSNSVGDGDEGEQIVKTDKYLIFTTGFKTYTPHQIGFKRIKPYNFPKRMDPGPSLKERLVLRERKKELMRSSSPPPEPNWLDYDSVCDRFDKVDHVIDLHGHIIGMGLSPDQRYLYVNSRPWPQGYVIRNPLDPPPIAQEIDIHVIDLVTLKQVGTMLRAHKAYTPNNECFFIFLAVCEEYVASGAEDKHGYLWDRHYGMCLAKFPHLDVVNSVAFNPKDPEMLVTTSDDHRVKIWRSKSAVRRLGLLLQELPSGIEVRKGSSQSQRGKSSDSRFCPE